MEVLGLRFCSVSDEAQKLARFLGEPGLGPRERPMEAPPGARGERIYFLPGAPTGLSLTFQSRLKAGAE